MDPALPADAPPLPAGPFSETEYHFTTGLRSGEVATIRSVTGETLLTYRSFAGVIGIVATLVAAIVGVAGCAAALFLLAEGAPVRAAVALLLTLGFATFIAMLVPRTTVTLYDGPEPALSIAQRKGFPSTWIVTTPHGGPLAAIRKSPFSRLGRNRWTILHDGRYLGEAAEPSLGWALVRKFYGKFSRRFETDVLVTFGGVDAGRILRRPDSRGRVDVLDVISDALDRRVLVAVATLILGREP